MLRELHIKNLAIIDDASANFEKGLNVLTGETGAGKSIIIDALCLALGERASTEVIRSGEKEAVVEAFFDIPPKLLNSSSRRFLQDLGINIENGIILKRILSAQGKNRAYINDSMVNVQTLSEISKGIIDVHGQYEYQSLLSPDNQLDILGFQVNEIETADLKTGEEKELSEEVKILSSASLLTELANQAYESLYSSDSACLTS